MQAYKKAIIYSFCALTIAGCSSPPPRDPSTLTRYEIQHLRLKNTHFIRDYKVNVSGCLFGLAVGTGIGIASGVDPISSLAVGALSCIAIDLANYGLDMIRLSYYEREKHLDKIHTDLILDNIKLHEVINIAKSIIRDTKDYLETVSIESLRQKSNRDVLYNTYIEYCKNNWYLDRCNRQVKKQLEALQRNSLALKNSVKLSDIEKQKLKEINFQIVRQKEINTKLEKVIYTVVAQRNSLKQLEKQYCN